MAVPRVLVVDKNEETCAYVSDVLVNSGFRVDVANDAQTALEKCESQHVLLVESDLPDIDGVELFRRAQRRHASLGAILVTHFRSYERLQTAVDAGMWDVLSKPLNVNRLIPMVEEVAGETG